MISEELEAAAELWRRDRTGGNLGDVYSFLRSGISYPEIIRLLGEPKKRINDELMQYQSDDGSLTVFLYLNTNTNPMTLESTKRE